MTSVISEISVDVPWGQISGYSWGNPTSELKILALHGWLDNSATFLKLVPLLSPDFHYVAIDLPGHGKSSPKPPGSNYHFEEYLTDVEHVIKSLGWTQFIFLGHSLGGSIASTYAGALPDRVVCMALIDNIGRIVHPPDRVVDMLNKRLATITHNEVISKMYPGIEAAAEKLWRNYHKKDPGFTLEAARVICERGVVKLESDGGGRDRPAGYQFSVDTRHKKNPRYMFNSVESSNEAFMKNISCPTLLIQFKQSYINQEILNKSLSAVPKEKITVIKVDGGHHAHLYSPEVVAPIINSFLSIHCMLGHEVLLPTMKHSKSKL